jgi:dolichol-phosphate mannosyltransferase
MDVIAAALKAAGIPFEFVIADDNSTDGTAEVVEAKMQEGLPTRFIVRRPPAGYGRALRSCLAHSRGDVVVVAMPDRSDDPADVVRCYEAILAGNDAVFGSRFIAGSAVRDYPRRKLLFNRLGNKLVQWLFRSEHNDLTNSLKAYRREAIRAVLPLSAAHFNANLELALGVQNRGFRIATIPLRWNGATWHAARHRVRDLGRRHLATVIKAWAEGRMLRDDLLLEHDRASSGARDLVVRNDGNRT